MYFASSYNQKKDNNNLKTKNNQNCQKIKLYGSPTTKELKKRHSSRPVGGAQMGSPGGEDSRQGGGWRMGSGGVAWWQADRVVRHLHADKLGGTTGE